MQARSSCALWFTPKRCLCCTSNLAATLLQYPTTESPFTSYSQGIKTQYPKLGLVGTTVPDVLARIRAVAPERLIMALVAFGQRGQPPNILAGLNASGDGLLIPFPKICWLVTIYLSKFNLCVRK